MTLHNRNEHNHTLDLIEVLMPKYVSNKDISTKAPIPVAVIFILTLAKERERERIKPTWIGN